jgi:UDPglucose 6-dehydrogenase
MRIAVLGAGYVGLVSGACLSDFGHSVTCIDPDASKIEALHRGEVPIFEPGLDEIIKRNVSESRLAFTTDGKDAIADADAVFIAVGTPERRGDGHADLKYVYAAAEEIGRLIQGFTVVITKSTVPVGTGDEIEKIIAKSRTPDQYAVVSNPEFLREGAAIGDFKRPDRIVVGTENPDAQRVMREVYRPLFLNETPILFTGRRTAELIKYAANAFLAMKITFINEIADLCEATGADVQQVARGIGLDKRISPTFLHAGPGYGGSCFPKDTKALAQTARLADVPLTLVDATIAANASRKNRMATVIDEVAGGISGKTVGLLGLTFKPNTDDIRDSPSLDIIPALQKLGARIKAFDPKGAHEVERYLAAHGHAPIEMSAGPYEALDGADILVIVTEWDQFRALDMERVRNSLKQPLVVDLRNVYEPAEMARLGFKYRSIGRPVAG